MSKVAQFASWSSMLILEAHLSRLESFKLKSSGVAWLERACGGALLAPAQSLVLFRRASTERLSSTILQMKYISGASRMGT